MTWQNPSWYLSTFAWSPTFVQLCSRRHKAILSVNEILEMPDSLRLSKDQNRHTIESQYNSLYFYNTIIHGKILHGVILHTFRTELTYSLLALLRLSGICCDSWLSLSFISYVCFFLFDLGSQSVLAVSRWRKDRFIAYRRMTIDARNRVSIQVVCNSVRVSADATANLAKMVIWLMSAR